MKTVRTTQPPLTVGAWLRYELIWDHLSLRDVHGAVLEMGCGLGALGARLRTTFDYTACEADPTSRAQATSVLSPSPVLESLDDLDPETTFDAVLACEVVEHIEHDAVELSGWRKLLKPGGAIVLSVPAYQERFGPHDTLAGHYRRYSPTEIGLVLTDAGFEDVSVDHYGFPVTEILEPMRNLLAKRTLASHDQSLSAATAASARILQPNAAAAALATRAATAPFRALQRQGHLRRRGAGLVVSAVSPSTS